MILSYGFKLKPSSSQSLLMSSWLDMLRSHYNFCLRDRIESYEQVKAPKLGAYCDLKSRAECYPLTCSVSKNSSLGNPFKGDKKRNAYEMQSSELPNLKQIKSVIGCDLGVKKLIALSNGEQIKNPQFEKQKERTKTIRQRRTSRKKRGSKNQRKAYQKLAKIDQKIVNQRNDYQWKIANQLTRLADVIVLEDLNIKGMIKRCNAKQNENGKYLKNGQSAKKGLNRLIRDCSWGNLKLKIQSVAEKFGCIYLEVNPKYTSQKCSHCGHIDKANRDKERFVCISCGFIADADNQAAINIGIKGLETLGISPSKLLRVPQKVTTKSELTDSRNREKSITFVVEPSYPQFKQLNLFELSGCWK